MRSHCNTRDVIMKYLLTLQHVRELTYNQLELLQRENNNFDLTT